MPLANTSLIAKIASTVTSALDFGTASFPVDQGRVISLANGTGAGQADKFWSDQRTLTASSTEDLDLSGSSLLDPYGAAVVFARVKLVLVSAAAGNTNNVIVGANVVNGWATMIGPTGASGGTVTLRPGAFAAFGCTDATGWAVTAGTGDLLHVANSAGGTSVTYDIFIVGSSA